MTVKHVILLIDRNPPGYLKSFDLEANRGRGAETVTAYKRRALHFENLEAAFECWRGQSRTVPLRTDGKPNRPLTAYAATFETIDVPDDQPMERF